MFKNKFFIFLLCQYITGFSLLHTAIPPPVWAQQSSTEIFLVAQKAFEDGFYDVAIRYINQLLTEHPDSEKRVEAKLLLGQCLFFKRQYLKAYEIFQNLLDEPKHKDATLFWLGETNLKGSDLEGAIQQYNQLINLFPQSTYTPQAYYSLGWVYYEKGDYVKSREKFSQLINNFPVHQLSEDAAFKLGETAYNLGEYEHTIQYFSKYIIKYPNSTRHPQAYFYIAESYYYLENYITAVTYYAKAEDIAYDNQLILMSRVSLGWGYLKLSKFSLAQQYFDSALSFSNEKNIRSDDVYLGQAHLFNEIKQYQKSLKSYNKLITNFPKSQRITEAYLGKANVLYTLGNYSKAIETYQKLIQIFLHPNLIPPDIIEKTYFGLAWSYLKNGNIDDSIKTFKQIQDQTKNRIVKISALTQIGDAYQDTQQYKKSIEIYDQILKKYPDSIYADYVQYRQGVALLKMKKLDSAILSLQSLLANYSESQYTKDAKYYLSLAYFKKGDWATAKEYSKDFLKIAPISNEFRAEAQYLLSLCQFRLHNYSKALESFKKVVKNYPQRSSILKNSEVYIGKSLNNLKKHQEAITQFMSIIQKYPNTQAAQDALMWLGDYYLEQANYDQAIATYSQFVKDFPGSNQIEIIYYELGQAYRGKGEYDKAVNVFTKVANFEDKEVYAKAKLAIADIFSRNLDPESALETYKKIITTSPEFQRDAYMKIAEVYLLNNEYTKAIENYTQSLQAKRGASKIKKSEVQFQIADVYELINQADRALEEYLKIPYLYPNDISWVIKSYLRSARLFEDRDQWKKAKTIYKKIMKYNTDEVKFVKERLEWIEKNIKIP